MPFCNRFCRQRPPAESMSTFLLSPFPCRVSSLLRRQDRERQDRAVLRLSHGNKGFVRAMGDEMGIVRHWRSATGALLIAGVLMVGIVPATMAASALPTATLEASQPVPANQSGPAQNAESQLTVSSAAGSPATGASAANPLPKVSPLPSVAGAKRLHAGAPDFAHLASAERRAAACDAKSQAIYETGDNKKILMALNEQGKCLEVILFGLAREFYASDAFGRGGVEARIHEMRETMEHLYSTIYSEPRTCAPNCGEVYQIWAAEAYVTSVRIMLDDMIDRLKDESPYHRSE